MKTFAKIGLVVLGFGFLVAVLGAIVIRTSLPRPPVVAEAARSESKADASTKPIATPVVVTSTSSPSESLTATSAAAQNSAPKK